jgi:glycosyltransferase involved in cell wall biosynthesis
MACGLPIIATCEGGREELLKENAVNVPYGKPSALSEKVVNLLNDGKSLARMGQISQQIASRYSWSAVAERYLEINSALVNP